MVVVAVQPVHDGLGMPAGPGGNLCGTVALNNVMQSEEPLATASMRRAQGQTAQISRCLAPALMINV